MFRAEHCRYGWLRRRINAINEVKQCRSALLRLPMNATNRQINIFKAQLSSGLAMLPRPLSQRLLDVRKNNEKMLFNFYLMSSRKCLLICFASRLDFRRRRTNMRRSERNWRAQAKLHADTGVDIVVQDYRRTDESDEDLLRKALEAAIATNSVADIARVLGCSEGRALALRRKIATTSPQLLMTNTG